MKNKIKFLSIILFVTALLVFIPKISHAYESDAEVPINYTIKINKIDSADSRNLRGARFTLKDIDGNVVATQTTDDDGVLSFGNIKTYGTGTDIYYIEEVKTPRGYILDEKETIEVNVEKTVTNIETGGYKLKITCQTLNYDTDITRYDFVPVATKDQLKHIGSGAVYIYDGKPYRYTANTNYRLMNDIDLGGEQWEPINIPVSGIFDGNGHSIKNLTITSNSAIDYKEVGLFKKYEGIVVNLKMENVSIAIPGYTDEATSISGKGGVGAFAGFMGSGTFKDCIVSGNISAGVDNVGGLVGHTDENIIIKLQNCINYANITAYDSSSVAYSWDDYKRYNVGGLIGCAMCSLSVDNCSNEGTFSGNASNVGGIVGHVESKGYEEKAVKAGYAEDGNTITLVIGNSRSEGEYDLYLEDHDLRSLNILPGGVFTVYDSTLEPIEGFENITLEEGRLRIGTVNIKFEGRDTYFVKDITPVEGYRKIAGYIKVVVTRYWDFEAEKFRVTVDSKVIDENKIQDEIGNNTDIDLDSITDTFAPDISFDNVGWNTAKAVFINCTNNGVINAYRDVGGIAGSIHHAKTTFEDCTNNADVSGNGYGKAAGMVAELYRWGEDDFCEIKNCKNYGKISSNTQRNVSTGGMAAQVVANIKIKNCENEGQIFSTGPSGAGGIVSDATGLIYIDNCKNSGVVEAHHTSVDSEVGGIIGKNMTRNVYADPINIRGEIPRNSNYLFITNCENTGNLSSNSHLGGILGYTEAGHLEIKNCKTYSKNPNEKIIIDDTQAADKGCIAGYVSVPTVEISNCKAEDVDLRRSSSNVANTYGMTGGMIGNWCSLGNAGGTLISLNINNCEVNRSNIHTKGQCTGGIIGGAGQSQATITISKCKVNSCNIWNEYGDSTYGSVAGIFGNSMYNKVVIIDECDVTNCNIDLADSVHLSGGDSNTAGIIALANGANVLEIKNCNVEGTRLQNWCRKSSGTSTTGGIIAHTQGTGNSSRLIIDNCTVKGKEKENKTKEDFDIFVNDEDCTGVAALIRDYKQVVLSKVAVEDCYLVSESVDSTSSVMSGMISYTDSPLTMVDCKVDNVTLLLDTPTPVGGTNISGFVGMTNYSYPAIFSNCDISNSTFISPGSYGTLANITGIAGYTSGETTLENCDVYNCEFRGTSVSQGAPSAANVAGLLGANPYSNVNINNCTVKSCNLSSDSTPQSNKGNCTIAGMVGVVNDINIKNSTVEDCTLTSGAMCTGGVVGCVNNSANINNVTAKDIDIVDRAINMYSEYSSSRIALRSMGGIIGTATTFTGTKLTVENVDMDSQALTIGGIAGNLARIESFTDASVSNLTVNNTASAALIPEYGAIGGLIGRIYMSNKTIENCSVSGATLTGDYDTVAGLIGVVNGTGTISESTVTGFTGKNKNTFIGAYSGHSGGLIGITTGATLTVTGTVVKNSNITADDKVASPKHLGGMIGLSGDVSFNDSDVINTSLNNKTFGATGGFVGQTAMSSEKRYLATISDCSVTGSNTISTLGHAGGFVGCGLVDITSPTITGMTIRSTSDGMCAGGIAGITDNSSTISNVTISNITVTAGQHVGGVAAVMYGTVTGGSISNVTLTSTGSGTNEVGGVAGVLNGSLSGVTIDNATVSSVAGDIGGAVGATVGTVDNVTVTNTTFSSSKVIGGIVGAGMGDSPTITNVTVDDATAAAIEADTVAVFKGRIIGVPNNGANSNSDASGDSDQDNTTNNTISNAPQSLNLNSVRPVNSMTDGVNEELTNNTDEDNNNESTDVAGSESTSDEENNANEDTENEGTINENQTENSETLNEDNTNSEDIENSETESTNE